MPEDLSSYVEERLTVSVKRINRYGIVNLSKIGLRLSVKPAISSLTNQYIISRQLVCSGSNFR